MLRTADFINPSGLPRNFYHGGTEHQQIYSVGPSPPWLHQQFFKPGNETSDSFLCGIAAEGSVGDAEAAGTIDSEGIARNDGNFVLLDEVSNEFYRMLVCIDIQQNVEGALGRTDGDSGG